MKRTLAGIAIGTVVTTSVVLLWPGGSVGQTARSAPHHVASATQDPGAEGIKVHGRWTIETRNPDGSVAEIHRFENALTSAGGPMLVRYLGRDLSVNLWAVEIAGIGFCPVGQMCDMREHGATNSGTHVDTLEMSHDGGVLTLHGTYPIAQDGEIRTVRTITFGCPPDVAPDELCSGFTTSATFTQKALPTPIGVVEGQQVLVTVDISFS